MVDRAECVLAWSDGSLTGGTANCVRYAEKRHRQLVNIYVK